MIESRFLFQLSELHIYVIPTDLWQVERRLVDTSIIEQCVSVGFVRSDFQHMLMWVNLLIYRDRLKGLYVVARSLMLLLLTSSACPCLGPA